MSRNKYEAIKAIQDSLYKLDELKILIDMLKSDIDVALYHDDDYDLDYYRSKIGFIHEDVCQIQNKTNVIWNRLVKELADE